MSTETDLGGVAESAESTGAEISQETAPKAEVKESVGAAGAVSSGTGSKKPPGSNPATPAENSQPVPPVYTPNYKFKANQKEMEFDELLRPAIKNAEAEKKVRELYEKAYGLDSIKPERDQLKTQFGELNQAHSSLQSGLNVINRFVQKKDYESFFQALGIPKTDVMQYALLQLKLQDASPEQRAAYEQTRQTALEAEQLREQNQHLQSTFEQQSVAMRTNELNLVVQKPEVSAVMQAFDSRMGRVGAFRDEVIKRGQYHAYRGQDISADQAVQEVCGLLGHYAQNGQEQSGQTGEAPVAPARKPTIPNIRGQGQSPAKKVFRTLDDLKKHAKHMEATEGASKN